MGHCGKAIAEPALGVDEAWMIGSISQFVAQPPDKYFQVVRLAQILGSPDALQQQPVWERLPCIERKLLEQPVFGGRERDRCSPQADFADGGIQFEIANHDTLVR